MDARFNSSADAIRVLEADPELGVGIPKSAHEGAVAALQARVYRAEPGSWKVRTPTAEPGAFGLLILGGVLGLRTSVNGRSTYELVGSGDLLQPWVQLGAATTLQPTADWEVIQPSSLALLDRRFAAAAARWPEVAAGLMYRLVLRSRRLCYQLAVSSSPRIDERILYMLWAFADRWGHVTDEGTVLEIALTHQQVADLVCATRPTTSSALGNLRERGLITYTRDRFVLCGSVPGEVTQLKRQVALDG